MDLNEQQLKQIADNIQAKVKEERAALYRTIGREAAYTLMGVGIGLLIAGLLKWIF
jgi:hypothetical protein